VVRYFLLAIFMYLVGQCFYAINHLCNSFLVSFIKKNVFGSAMKYEILNFIACTNNVATRLAISINSMHNS